MPPQTFADVIHLVHEIALLIDTVGTQEVTVGSGMRLVPGLDMSVDARHLQNIGNDMQSGITKLLIVGGFNNGKSTLLNALLGTEAVVTGAVPTTAVITQLRQGDDERIVIYPRNGKPYTLDRDTYIKRFNVALQDTVESDVINFRDIDHVDLIYPTPIIESSVAVVDTPGMAENRFRTSLVLQYLPRAGALIIVFDALHPISKDERDFLSLLGGGKLTNVFFVVNRIDLVPKSKLAELQEWIATKLRPYFQESWGEFDADLYQHRVFFVDARTGSESFANGVCDEEAYEHSGMRLLRDELRAFLTHEQRLVTQYRAMLPSLVDVVTRSHIVAQQRIEVLSQPLEMFEMKMKDAHSRVGRMQESADLIQARICQLGEVVRYQLYGDMLHHITAMRATWEDDVRMLDFDELANINLFSTLVKSSEQRRLSEILAKELERYIQIKLAQWAKGIPERLNETLQHLVEDVESDLSVFRLELSDVNRWFTGTSREVAPFSFSYALEGNVFATLYTPEMMLRFIGPIADQLTHDLVRSELFKTTALSAIRTALSIGAKTVNAGDNKTSIAANLASWVMGFGADALGKEINRRELRRELQDIQQTKVDIAFGSLGPQNVARMQSIIQQILIDTLKDHLFDRIETQLTAHRERIFGYVQEELNAIGRQIGEELNSQIDNMIMMQQSLFNARKDRQFSLTAEQERVSQIEAAVAEGFTTICNAILGRELRPVELERMSSHYMRFVERQTDDAPTIVTPLPPANFELPPEVNPVPLTAAQIQSRLGQALGAMFPKSNSADDALDQVSHQLSAMIGLDSVKARILELMDYQAELKRRSGQVHGSEELLSLHLVFTGNPGTGKTTVAELVGKIYRRLGLLRIGHVVAVTRADLVGEYIGASEKKVRAIIERAQDGVLFIDEAYNLIVDDSPRDYGITVLRELMRWMESMRGRLAVVVAGYPEEMRAFLRSDPGLLSRFPASNHIHFPDYTAPELLQILDRFIAEEHYTVTPTAHEQLALVVEGMYARREAQFGNAREMRSLASALIRRRSTRVHRTDLTVDAPIDVDDIDNYYRQYIQARPTAGSIDDALAKLNAMIGLAPVKAMVNRLIATVQVAQRLGDPVRIDSLHMIFRGPPGTGKTTVAQYMGEILHTLGLLRRGHVTSVVRKDLVGRYIGESEQKTAEVLNQALHGILFIDEAYDLFSGDSESRDYGRRVLNLLTATMDEPEFRSSTVVILAGYPDELDQLLDSNPGLRDRFRTPVDFHSYTDEELINIAHAMCAGANSVLTPEVEQRTALYLARQRENDPVRFGNARAVRKLLDEMRGRRDERVIKLNIVDQEEFRRTAKRFEVDDVPPLPEDQSSAVTLSTPQRDIVITAANIPALEIVFVPPAADRPR